MPNSINNVVVIAQQQTAGKGTHENEWLSPIGCCMFTLFLKIGSDFSLSRMSLLQFAAGLASVKAVKSSPGLQVIILFLFKLMRFIGIVQSVQIRSNWAKRIMLT